MNDAEGDETRNLRLKIKEAIRAIVEHIVVRITLNGRTSRTAECEVLFRQGGQRSVSICCDMRMKIDWAMGFTPAAYLSKDAKASAGATTYASDGQEEKKSQAKPNRGRRLSRRPPQLHRG